jgi:hypothetical protein
MLKTLLFVTIATAPLSALACTTTAFADASAPGASGAGDFRFEKTLDSGAKLEVKDRNGAIRIEPAAGDLLEIVAVKTGKPEDVARVQVVTREEGGVIVVCALWPGQDTSTCRPGASTFAGGEDVRVRVDFQVRVPAKILGIDARTMNGAIMARSAAGELSLSTMNGAIDVTGVGPITAETMNGPVVASAAAGHPIKLTTKNGRVEVSLSAAANADVEASTTNGRITSEFGEVPAAPIPRPHDVKLRLGSGGAPISLRTLNGNVAVRRSGT